MTDPEIIDQLRSFHGLKGWPVLREAADRIEALTLESDPDGAFSDSFYDSHITHALDCLREGVPYQVNADGALALIQRASEDRRRLRK